MANNTNNTKILDIIMNRQNALANEIGNIADIVIAKYKENPSDEFLKGIAIHLMQARSMAFSQNALISETYGDKSYADIAINAEAQAVRDTQEVEEMLNNMAPEQESSLGKMFK